MIFFMYEFFPFPQAVVKSLGLDERNFCSGDLVCTVERGSGNGSGVVRGLGMDRGSGLGSSGVANGSGAGVRFGQ